MTAATAAWIGTILQLLGALALASRALSPRAAYAMMGPGAAALLAVALSRTDWPQAVLMGTFLAINACGFARWAR